MLLDAYHFPPPRCASYALSIYSICRTIVGGIGRITDGSTVIYVTANPLFPKSTMAHEFTLNPESLKRNFAVYVVIARGESDTKLYVGKTGDNRDGCNPIISRCGNHFSYNEVHSQVRNKVPDHERRTYTYIFDHFDEYHLDNGRRRKAVDRINEMERWLREEVQKALVGTRACQLLNPLSRYRHVPPDEQIRRAAFRTDDAQLKILGIVNQMIKHLKPLAL